MASKILNAGYIIQSTEFGKSVKIYYRSDSNARDSWTTIITEAKVFDDEEAIYNTYDTIYSRLKQLDPNKWTAIGNFKIIKIEINILDSKIDKERLKEIRQKHAIRKLSKKDIDDLGLNEIAAYYRLAHDDEKDGEFFNQHDDEKDEDGTPF